MQNKLTIFKAAEVLTMNDSVDDIFENGYRKSKFDAVLVEDGRIKELGLAEDFQQKFPTAEIRTFEACTLMPSFIDSHSHFMGVASSLLQVPLEECYSFAEICDKIRQFIGKQKEDDSWIFAKGYDHNQLHERKHIPKHLLDEISGKHPLIIQHGSGHSGVLNSKALELLGINDHSPNPEGGLIGKENGVLNGFLEENAFIQNVMKAPLPDASTIVDSIKEAQRLYQSYGITTMHEGMMVDPLLPMYQIMIEEKILQNDIVSYVSLDCLADYQKAFPDSRSGYASHFKLGGLKMFLDGSPQGRTAWMRSAYVDDADYFAYGTMKFPDIVEMIREAYKNNMQIITHVNGDRAIEEYINAIKELKKEYPDIEKIRPVMIHAQLMGIDQLDDVKNYGFIPSYFAAHVYHYGDTHIENFGKERASQISPLKSTLDKNIIFTIHQDSPVIEPNVLESIWVAAKRLTKQGILLGESEIIPVYDALKAATLNAAYQYFEEHEKGSIEVGKRADLLVLDQNPTSVGIDEIRTIKVRATIKDGDLIFEN